MDLVLHPRELRLLAESRRTLRSRASGSATPGAYAVREPDLDHPECLLLARRPSFRGNRGPESGPITRGTHGDCCSTLLGILGATDRILTPILQPHPATGRPSPGPTCWRPAAPPGRSTIVLGPEGGPGSRGVYGLPGHPFTWLQRVEAAESRSGRRRFCVPLDRREAPRFRRLLERAGRTFSYRWVSPTD